MRNLANRRTPSDEREISAWLENLQAHVEAGGNLRRYPYWYTMYALSEVRPAGLAGFLKRTAPKLERAARSAGGAEPWRSRKTEIARRLLAIV
jgi:hypothetical protein